MTSVVLFSGGMDSATLLASTPNVALALSVDYGQRHRRELTFAAEFANRYGVRHEVLDLTGWGRLLKGSALTDDSVPVPLGHYADPSMAVTIVPNRNAVFLMAAVGVAQAIGASRVFTAVHAGDHPVYPDCRPVFITAADRAAGLSTEGKVSIHAPFVAISKTEIAHRGHDLGVPFELTWSCYQGGELHCGKCGTCVERREAFRDAGVPDPTKYEDA